MSLTQINKAGLDEIALDHVFTIGASGSSAYTFQGEGLNGTVNNPTLYLTRGKTYRFENGSGGHPIRIQSTSGASGTAYNTGVTNNAGSGTVIVEVQHDAPDVLYYQCTSHAAMNGILYITGALADGGVTTAKIAANAVTTPKILDSAVSESKLGSAVVTTAKIADDAVTNAKLANSAVNTLQLETGAVTAPKLANNACTTDKIPDGNVTSAKIADQAVTLAKLPHGTSSNDGKFLRANNGADPTFESVPSPAITGISNATNNRILTSEGGTTVNCESALTFDGTTLGLKSNDARITIEDNTSGTVNSAFRIIAFNGTNFIQSGTNLDNNSASTLAFSTINGATEWARFDSSGRFMIGTTTEGNGNGDELTIAKNSGPMGMTLRSGDSSNCHIYFSDATSGTGEYAGYIAYQHSDNSMHIGTNSSERIHIKSDGKVGIGMSNPDDTLDVNGTFQVSSNAYVSGTLYALGNDIRIGGTGTGNSLDDYEEGEYTVTAACGGGSITLKSAYNTYSYTKIGRLVTINGRVDVQSVSSPSGELTLSLPFTVGNGTGLANAGAASLFIYGATTGATGDWVGWTDDSLNVLYLRFGNNTSGTQGASYIQGNTEFRVTFTYMTS